MNVSIFQKAIPFSL
jgi:proteasome lid subunit RPN8/RPN11